mgnify:CR=1 FL=1
MRLQSIEVRVTCKRIEQQPFFRKEAPTILLILLIAAPLGFAFFASQSSGQATINSVAIFYNYVQSTAGLRIAEVIVFDMLMYTAP